MLDVYTMLIIMLIVLGLQIVFFLTNIFILGFCLSKVLSVPTPKQIIKEIMDTKVPVQVPTPPQGLVPDMPPDMKSTPMPPPSKKETYFG